MKIERLDADRARARLPELVSLLQEVVNNGGTVGFMPPLSDQEATAYWQGVARALEEPLRVLLIAEENAEIVGTVQLELCGRSNGLHRAEVMKVMVHPSSRNRGIGAQLMSAIELEARSASRTTLVLDTRQGEPSERLYASLGYIRAGTIPEYAMSADGTLHATVYMYKLLRDA